MYINHQNDGVHVRDIILSTTCSGHNADKGVSCWDVYVPSVRNTLPAVCGKRIRRAGFVGKISPTSLSRWTAGNTRHANSKVKTQVRNSR